MGTVIQLTLAGLLLVFFIWFFDKEEQKDASFACWQMVETGLGVPEYQQYLIPVLADQKFTTAECNEYAKFVEKTEIARLKGRIK